MSEDEFQPDGVEYGDGMEERAERECWDDWLKTACELIDEGDYVGAIKPLENCIVTSTSGEEYENEARYHLANIFDRMQNYDEALKLLEPLLNRSDTEWVIKAWYLKGRIHHELREDLKALDSFEYAASITPINEMENGIPIEGKEGLIQTLSRLQRNGGDKEFFKTLRLKRLDQAVSLNNIGVGLLNQNNINEAKEKFEEALAYNGNFAEPYCNLGVALYRELQELRAAKSQSIREFNKDLPDYLQEPFELGIAHSDWDRKLINYKWHPDRLLERAQGEFEMALKINKDADWAWNNLGVILQELHCYDDSINAFNKALEINPINEKARLHLNDLLSMMNSQKSV